MADFDALKKAIITGNRKDVTAIVQAAIDGKEDINGDMFSRNGRGAGDSGIC